MTSSGTMATVVDMRTTTHLSDIMDTALLRQMLEAGYIRQQVHPDDENLVILNYTEKAQFEKVWNDATLQCRGLIVRRDPEGLREAVIVARPFKKFFNLNEQPFSEPIQYDPTARVEVTDKMDGSLGILYTAPDGLPAIATRGSFASEQALHATKVYRQRYYNQWHPHEGSTYLFEIIYPENRIVLDYGPTDDLVLLGEVVTATGAINGPKAAALLDGWPGPVTQVFDVSTLTEALQLADRENAEGLVVRYTDESQKMVKVKQDDYVALHKIIFGLNERAIWERLGAWETIGDIQRGLPEEFHLWVDQVAERLYKQAADINRDVRGYYNYLAQDPFLLDDRKSFAMKAKEHQYSGLLFALYDGKSITDMIWKMVKPEHSTFAHANANQSGAIA